MQNQTETQTEGLVTESLPNAMFRVKLADDKVILCHLSGKMKLNRIHVLPGDRVKVVTTPYDATKGRIIYRVK